jgi:ATP-dependent Clp protease ATP-binding subunit ClpC
MTSRRSEAELVTLRKRAQQDARARKETVTTVHLLAAVAAGEGSARELLAARRLDRDKLLRAARNFDEELDGAIGLALDAARDFAHRAALPSREVVGSSRGLRPRATVPPGGLHVLLALLSNRRFAAFRALGQCGIDIPRLRSAVTQVMLGLVAPPRPRSSRRNGSRPEPVRRDAPQGAPSRSNVGDSGRLPPRSANRARGRGRAVEVPWIPPPSNPRATEDRATENRATENKAPVSERRPRAATPKITQDKPVSEGGVASDERPPRDEVATTRAKALPSEGTAESAQRPSSQRQSSGRPSSQRQSSQRQSSARGSSNELMALDVESFPLLGTIGTNLTLAAALGRLEPVIGREQEVEQLLDVLAKRHANNPVLVGPAGVGKTSIAHGLARTWAADSEAPRILMQIPVGDLLAGTGTRGALAERLADIRREVATSEGRVVIFIDEIHELFAGSASDELTSELKTALSRGELPLVGATTVEDYRRYLEADPALARRFSAIEVEEPDEEHAFLLLRSVARNLGAHHGVSYSDEALALSVSWSIRYLRGRALPDKAVSVLDLAGARLKRRGGDDGEVEPKHVAEVVSELAAVPLERLLQTDHERMLGMERLLGERVVGHAAPLQRIAAVLRRNAAGLRGRRPIGTFLLLGPTGVGKTETAKAIAEALFHSPDAMTRLDMSEYAEAHAVSRVVGAPPGYIGHDDGGALTEAVRRRPYQVVLLDEIEKAHRDVLESFLQVFDEGRLTDGRGRTVDFTNTVIVLTSNIGASELRAIQTERRVGFQRTDAQGPEPERMREVAIKAARDTLPPELYNRLDEVLFFKPLGRHEVGQVARRLLAGLGAALQARGIELDVEEAVIEALLDRGGYDPELGARPMRRAIASLVEAPLADMILSGELARGGVALLGVEDGELSIDALQRRRTA